MTESLLGTTLKDRYRLDEFLGRGGMAEVYKAWDSDRSTYLALKLLRKDLARDVVFLRRFRREAQNLAQLQHPHIVRFYGLEQDELQAFMLMDYVEGEDLKTEIFLHRGEGIPPQRTVEIIQPVCSALAYAHKRGYIHCDVKPGNIMLEESGRVLIADFGIARLTDAATATMVGAGTPAYMAPEQVKGLDPVPQTDIYALGVVLFEMLTGGERPFTGERAETTGTMSSKVRWEQVNLDPVSPRKFNPELSPNLEAVIMRCLEKDSKARYQTPLDVLDGLKHGLSHISTSSTEVDLPMRGHEVDEEKVSWEEFCVKEEKMSDGKEERKEISPKTERKREGRSRKTRMKWLYAGLVSLAFLLILSIAGMFSSFEIDSKLEPTQTEVSGVIKTQTPKPTGIVEQENQPNRKPTKTLFPTETATPAPTQIPYVANPYLGPLPQNAYARFGKGTIEVIKLSPEGNYLAVGGSLGIWIYEPTTLNLIKYIPTEIVDILAWSRDDRFLSSGYSNRKIVSIWDLETFERTGRIQLDDFEVATGLVENHPYCMQWSPHGDLLAVGTRAGYVAIFDSTFDLVNKYLGLTSSVTDLEWSPEGRLLAGAAGNAKETSLIVWGIKGSKEQKNFDTSYTESIAWSPDGKSLAITSLHWKTPHITIWDLENQQIIKILRGVDNQWVHLPELTWFGEDDHEVIVSVEKNTDWTVDFYDPISGKHLSTYKYKGGLFPVKSNEKSMYVSIDVFRGDGNRVNWNLERAENIEKRDGVLGFNYPITSLNWSPDDSQLLGGNRAGDINFWDVENNRVIDTIQDGRTAISLVYWSDNDKIISVSSYSTIRSFEDFQVEKRYEFKPGMITEHSNRGLNYYYADYYTTTRRVDYGDYRIQYKYHTDVIRFNPSRNQKVRQCSQNSHWGGNGNYILLSSTASSRDSDLLAFGFGNGIVIVREEALDKRLYTFQFKMSISSLALSVAKKMLATGLPDGTIIVRELGEGKILYEKSAHLDEITELEFSPDSNLLVSGSAGGEIKIWNPEEGELLRTLNGHFDIVNSLKWDSAGKILASSSDDGTMVLWNRENIVP